MKPKLPCCEINKKASKWEPQKTVECAHCECVFEKNEQLDDHIHEIHNVQFTGKRQLVCCEQNEYKRMKKEYRNHECHYCECEFQKKYQLVNHMENVHQCPKCRQIVLTEEIRAEHEIKHEEEQRKKEELKKKQEERDEDLVLNYVKTNKLDEYQPEPDYKPNIDYIITCGLNIEEISRFVKKFDVKNIFASIVAYFDFDAFTCEEITYLLENGAVSVEDVAWFLDFFSLSSSNHKILSQLVAYFLDKGYEIKREWVAKAIDDDALMERIKQKYTYTFDEIYGALEVNPLDNQLDRDEFYVQVHKHFPNPDFKDPFANPFIDFETILTEHYHDHLHNRYFYDEARDKLSIVVGYEPNRREISLGSCKEMLNMNLQDLIQQYNKAMEGYDYTNDQLSKLFDKREQKLDYAKTKKEREDILEEYFYKIDKDALLERNYMANEVSKLYFVIAQK